MMSRAPPLLGAQVVADDFGERAARDTGLIEAGGAGLDGVAGWGAGRGVGVRELLAQAFAEF